MPNLLISLKTCDPLLTFLIVIILWSFLYLAIAFKVGCEHLLAEGSASYNLRISKFFTASEKNDLKVSSFFSSFVKTSLSSTNEIFPHGFTLPDSKGLTTLQNV